MRKLATSRAILAHLVYLAQLGKLKAAQGPENSPGDPGPSDPEAPEGYRYLQLRFTGCHGNLNGCNALTFKEGDTVINPASLTAEHCFASSELAESTGAVSAFDGGEHTPYRGAIGDKTGFLGMDTGGAYDPTAVVYQSYGYGNEIPTGFIVQGSNDNETWVDLWTVTGVPNVINTTTTFERV